MVMWPTIQNEQLYATTTTCADKKMSFTNNADVSANQELYQIPTHTTGS